MADDEDNIIAACASVIVASAGIACTVLLSQRKTRRKHRFWIRNYILERDEHGAFNSLLPHLSCDEKFQEYIRMDITTFNELLQVLAPEISRKSTRLR